MGRQTQLRERWDAAGQGHVFAHWGDLGPKGRERLLARLEGLDPEPLTAAVEAAANPATIDPGGLEPPEQAFGPDDPGRAALQDAGSAELRAGRVAVLTVAGGQGTRLGFDGPKGAFPIGPVSDRSLFGIFAQRLAGLGRRHGRPVPWLLMTSPATDAATRAFFDAQGFFGLDPEQVRFVVQGTLPALDLEGRVLLAAPGRLAEAPDGHGGVFSALRCSGALADLEARGVERVFYHHVDNPLARLADPAFLGLHAVRGAEMSCKAVEKLDPLENMGFLCRRAGQTAVIEYSEIPPEVVGAPAPSGAGLRFRLGSIGIHAFERSFLERVARGPSLPLHGARKPIPALDPQGRPATVEGWKLERFVFDALARARVVALMESRREDEYSPVKNARGVASPATARRDLTSCYRRWLADAGLEAPGKDETELMIEMDHSRIDGPDDLCGSEFRPITEAAPWIRIAKGAER